MAISVPTKLFKEGPGVRGILGERRLSETLAPYMYGVQVSLLLPLILIKT